MVELKAMDEGYIHIDCLHAGPVDPLAAPARGDGWQEAPDLPPHPWSDEAIVEVAATYSSITEGWRGDPSREFMREMIQKYGTCAMLAWEEGQVVGQLRFYPLAVAQLVGRAAPDKQPPAAVGAGGFEPDSEALWVQCVMTSRPYIGPDPDTTTGRDWPAMKEAGARKGVGLKLARALIAWAEDRGWKRIVANAHADLDCMYGQHGTAGKAFWEKAGFEVVAECHDEWPNDDQWKATVEAQATEKGMTKQEAWTKYQVAYEM